MEKFKSIPELIQSLNQLAIRINKGSVGLEEFEATLRDARELYERLVILRYKAIEDRNLMGVLRGEENAEPSEDPAEPMKAEEPSLAAKQISLIDSIEEISREAQPSAAAKPTNPKPAAPSRTEQKSEPKEPEKPVSSNIIPPISPAAQGPPDQPDSLAEKLSQTKIDDLTVAIGLNQKFRFIKELFKGDSSAYNEAVKSLNQCNNLEEAQQRLKNDFMTPYNWDEEDQLTLSFLNLIERRYQ